MMVSTNFSQNHLRCVLGGVIAVKKLLSRGVGVSVNNWWHNCALGRIFSQMRVMFLVFYVLVWFTGVDTVFLGL